MARPNFYGRNPLTFNRNAVVKKHRDAVINLPSTTKRAIICENTGQSFDSIIQASEYFGISASTICNSCREIEGRLSCKGLAFNYK